MCYKRLYYNQEENIRATHQAPSSNTKIRTWWEKRE